MASLADVLTVATLSGSWRRLKEDILKVRPTDLKLIQDPLNHLAYSIEADRYITALRQRVLQGRFAPSQPDVTRVAKRNGLRRPIVHAALEDAIVLGALMTQAQTTLQRELHDWVSFGGPGTGGARREEPYETWFEAFLKFHARADRLYGNDDSKVVISDIANFFPSINLDLLRSRVQRVEGLNLDDQALNLLFRILSDLGSAHSYDPFALRGLPQIPEDTSRVLANFLLGEVDEALRERGEAGRYTRYSDDMLFSAADERDANRVIALLQDSLERLGLAVNSGKTRVLTKAEWRVLHYPDENERVDEFVGIKGEALEAPLRERFELATRTFARSEPVGEYDRVLRRYYNLARRFRNPALTPYAWGHLSRFPESAPQILEYMQTLRPTLATVRQLLLLASGGTFTYDDLQIRAYETLLHLPAPNSQALRAAIEEGTVSHLQSDEPRLPYVDSLAFLLLFKVGSEQTEPMLLDRLSRTDCTVEVARQAYVILRARGSDQRLVTELPTRFGDTDLNRIAHLFDEIERRPAQVIAGPARRWLMPVRSTQPKRRILRTRNLPLWQAFATAPRSSSYARVREALDQEIRSIPLELRDRIYLARLRDFETAGSPVLPPLP